MGFKDLLAQEAGASRYTPCGTATFIAEQSPADRADILEALADTSIPSATIWRAVKPLGYRHCQQTLARHRRGDCQCPSQTN